MKEAELSEQSLSRDRCKDPPVGEENIGVIDESVCLKETSCEMKHEQDAV